jgi:tellurite resistance protein TehA-like permease
MSRAERGETTVPSWRRAARSLVAEVRPAAGSLVMGTGIVAVALALTGFDVASRALLGLAAAVWLATAAALASRILRRRAWVMRGARTPEALTSVAATCVLSEGLLLIG